MDIFSVFTLFGGLAFFLYGMNVMGSGLEKLAGGRLERIFEKLTSNLFKAVLLGAGVTVVIQSSSATTVMLVGFVNSGIMKLHQATGVIIGANIGKTVTSWLLSLSGIQGESFFIKMLKPSSFSPIFAIVGAFMMMLAKDRKKKDIGGILVGFAIIMFGMETMSEAMAPLADMPKFRELMLAFSNPLLGVLVGAVMTAILQASAASVGILQALSATGAISYGAAIPIIMGQNIGTCITAALSAIGTSKNAKRVAAIHLYFNVIGTIVLLIVFYIADAIFNFAFVDQAVSPLNIAVVHTVFNLATTAILLPFTKLLEKLAYLTIKETDGKSDRTEKDKEFRILDERFLSSPSFAIEHCRTMTVNMAELTRETMALAVEISHGYTEELDKAIHENENKIYMYEDRLGTYLVKISASDLTVADSRNISTLLHCIGDFERISDHATNIVKVAKEKHDKKIKFSHKAQEELEVVLNAVTEVMDLAVEAFITNDLEIAKKVEPIEEVIDQLRTRLKNRHVKRLQDGECTIELGFVFTDFLTNLERVSDHCSNIAVCLIQMADSNFETHEYIHELKKSGAEFDDMVLQYQEKYALPAKNTVKS